MTNVPNKAKVLCEYLKNNHAGRENVVSSKTLEAVLYIKNREIRRCVNILRCNGFPICSDENGYYYASMQQEIDDSIALLNNLITKISSAKNGLLTAHCNTKTHYPISIEIKLSIG